MNDRKEGRREGWKESEVLVYTLDQLFTSFIHTNARTKHMIIVYPLAGS